MNHFFVAEHIEAKNYYAGKGSRPLVTDTNQAKKWRSELKCQAFCNEELEGRYNAKKVEAEE
jgi:hypothetical protein